MAVVRESDNDPFAVFGEGRGLPVSHPLLGAGEPADRERQRLVALLSAGDSDEPLRLLREHARLMAPEIDVPSGELSEGAFWTLQERLWPVALRLGERRYFSRVEEVFCERLRRAGISRLADRRRADLMCDALEALGAVPACFPKARARFELARGGYVCVIHLHLLALLADGRVELTPPLRHAEHDAFGAVMAQWTLRDGPRAVLGVVLGTDRWERLERWLGGTNGRSVDQWLSPAYMPFSMWREAYWTAAWMSEDKLGADGWQDRAREELYAWCLGIPDSVYG